jgi:serine/threonine protein kinase
MSIPSVVRFIGYHEDVLNQRYQIIMEYVEGKTLEIIASPYYTNNEVSECVSSLIPIPLLTAAEILMSVTEACIPLEEKGIAHCDLSPKNLILNKEGKVRLVDLAFAVMVGEKSFVKLKVCRGCSPYQAPEISSHYQYNLKTDVYAMGSIASIFANEGEPFGKDDQLSCDEILRKVVSGERHRLSLFCNPSLKEAINLCWMAKPEDRPTMKALNKSFGELLAVEKRSLNANK